jgi:molybdate transport system substrate-binding protein
MHWLAFLGVVAVTAACGAPAPDARTGEIIVSAAASLTNVLQEAAQVYERQSGERVVLNLGSSNTLARQIAAGAQADLFISADTAQMDAVAAHIVAGTRTNLLSNQLAIVVPDDRNRRLTSPRDLLNPSIRRIAIGDPSAVPAGVYARHYLETIGIWEKLSNKVVPSGSVRLALAAVENGVADAAIVYRTDIATARGARAAFVVPPGEGPTIVYPAAVLRGPNEAGARRVLAFLKGAEAARVFERAGFAPLRPAP